MNNQESRAKELFDQIVGNPNHVALFQSWVDTKKQESDFLEFKGAGRIENKQIKQYWSQALSGFANTEGGVLIWGIATDRIASSEDSSHKIDAAIGFDLAPSPETLVQLLKDVKLDVVEPPVPGVDYRCFDAVKGDGAGFVVCFIPEGISKPYRADLDERKQYYQRIGDSFTIINHSMLASLFYPRTAPCFEMEAELTRVENAEDSGTSASPEGRQLTCYFEMSIRNVGTASARDMVLVVECNYALFVSWKDPLFGRLYKGVRVLASASRPIHPLEDKISCLSCTAEAPTHLNVQRGTVGVNTDPTKIAFSVTICALDTKPLRGKVVFDVNDVTKWTQSRAAVCKQVAWEL